SFVGKPVGGLAVAFDMRAVGELRRRARQQFLQQRLARKQRRGGNVDAVHVQQIEQRQRQPPLSLARQGGLQQVEILAGALARQQLAVERARAQAQRLDGGADVRKPVGPFQRVARPQPHLRVRSEERRVGKEGSARRGGE